MSIEHLSIRLKLGLHALQSLAIVTVMDKRSLAAGVNTVLNTSESISASAAGAGCG